MRSRTFPLTSSAYVDLDKPGATDEEQKGKEGSCRDQVRRRSALAGHASSFGIASPVSTGNLMVHCNIGSRYYTQQPSVNKELAPEPRG